MLVALRDPCSTHVSTAAWANHISGSRVSCSHLLILAVIQSTEVWLLALVALIEGTSEESIGLLVVVVVIVRILQSLVIEDALILCSLHGKLCDFTLDRHHLVE